jgi:hypothetical protein
MRNVIIGAGLLFAAAVAGCAPQPFVRSDGPVAASGVVVALVNQRCGRRYDNPISDVLDLTMALQVSNSADLPATFQAKDLRLVVDGDVVEPDNRDPPAEIPPRVTKPVSVRFVRYGDARCNEPMQLLLVHAIRLGDRELEVRPLSFTPNNSDT